MMRPVPYRQNSRIGETAGTAAYAVICREPYILPATSIRVILKLERELRRRGFHGQRMKHPGNGQLYVYEKSFK